MTDRTDSEATPARVLICDDDPVIRRAVTRHLRQQGFEVHAAGDGEEARARAPEVAPDVVLIDLTLPRMDGYSLLLHLRGHPVTRSTPIFVVSGEPAGSHREIAESLGASGYLEKPVDPARLVELVQTALDATSG